jgi:hypothetical protein
MYSWALGMDHAVVTIISWLYILRGMAV